MSRIARFLTDHACAGARAGPYIIAEIGVNHDGQASRALDLVDAAARAGADAVKVQYFRADDLLSLDARLALYQKDSGEHDPIAMLRRLELGLDDMRRVAERAHAHGLDAVCTVFSLQHVGACAELRGEAGFDAFKTASPDVVNKELLAALARTGRPLIVSTGGAERAEVERMLTWVRPGVVMQCVSSYPTSARDAAVGAVRDITGVFDGVPGYSDHTRETDTGALAVACGALVLEKHLTDDRGRCGPDHAASLEPAQLAEYARRARAEHARVRASGVEAAMERWAGDPRVGDGRKRVLGCERDVRESSRQSVVATRDIAVGEVIERADLTCKRPGTGIPGESLCDVVGRSAVRAIPADRVVRFGDVEGIGRGAVVAPGRAGTVGS